MKPKHTPQIQNLIDLFRNSEIKTLSHTEISAQLIQEGGFREAQTYTLIHTALESGVLRQEANDTYSLRL